MIYGKYKLEFPFLWLSNINKSTSGGKIFYFTIGHWSPRKLKEKTQGQIMEAVAVAEVMEECLLLVYASWLPQPYIVQKLETVVQEWHHPQWHVLSYQAQSKKMQHRLVLQRNFRNWYSLFQNISILCTVKIKLVSSSLKA